MSGLSSFLQSVSGSAFGEIFPPLFATLCVLADSHKGFVKIIFIRKCIFHKKLKFSHFSRRKMVQKGPTGHLAFGYSLLMPALNHAVHIGARGAKLILNYVGTVGVSCYPARFSHFFRLCIRDGKCSPKSGPGTEPAPHILLEICGNFRGCFSARNILAVVSTR